MQKFFYKNNTLQKRFSLVGKISLFLIIAFIAFVILAPLCLTLDPNAIDLDNKFANISIHHWLGTDNLGRDIFTRLIYGARISLSAVGAILAIILLLGISIGGIAGFVGGRLDSIIMRICDLFLSLPTIVLSLFFVGILGSGLKNVVIAIALTHWAWYARIVRSVVIELKNAEFVLLSSVYGATSWQNFKRNMFIPIVMQCLILATMDIGHMLLHIAGLSFLGLGVQPPQAEWGVMLASAKDFMWSNPELLLYPGFALFICVALFNLLGESLHDYYDYDLKNLH